MPSSVRALRGATTVEGDTAHEITERTTELLARMLEANGASLDDLAVRPSKRTGEHGSLRWILLHLVEEYARHNGHADLIRESIDGVTGE